MRIACNKGVKKGRKKPTPNYRTWLRLRMNESQRRRFLIEKGWEHLF